MDLGILLASPQVSQSSSRLGTCTCAFLSSCRSSVTLPFAWIKESVAFPRGFPTRLSHRAAPRATALLENPSHCCFPPSDRASFVPCFGISQPKGRSITTRLGPIGCARCPRLGDPSMTLSPLRRTPEASFSWEALLQPRNVSAMLGKCSETHSPDSAIEALRASLQL